MWARGEGNLKDIFLVLIAVGSVAVSVAVSAPVQADPPCAQFNVCQYMPNPYNGGPLRPAWELPGGYDLPGGSPTMCDPQAYRCYPATPGSGF